MFRFNKKIILSVLVYFIWVIYSSTANYFTHKTIRLDNFDKQLIQGATALHLVLPRNFDHNVRPTKEEYWRNIIRLSEFSDKLNLKFVYSVIEKDDKILFTAISATKQEISERKGFPLYFSEYNDAPPQIKMALATGKIQFTRYSDQWGHFRGVFVPLKAADGTLYVAAADIDISEILLVLQKNLLQHLLNTFLSILFILPLIFIFFQQLIKSNKTLQAANRQVQISNQALQQHKNNLERIVKKRTTELHQANLHLKKLSQVDCLTKIANRRVYNEVFIENIKVAKEKNTSIALLMIDIDYFKPYNDNYGHNQGDIALCKVAAMIAQSLNREIDLVARFGGEEFVVLLPFTDSEGGAIVAEKIRANIEALQLEHCYSKILNILTISIGVASLVGAELDEKKLLEQADKALYIAKDKGRNQISIYQNKLMSSQ